LLVKRCGGMTEFIPSPKEKREGVIHNHVLDLLANMDARLRRIEQLADAPSDLAEEFSGALRRIRDEEAHVQRLNDQFLDAGNDDSDNTPS
jgi:hypothetical protein